MLKFLFESVYIRSLNEFRLKYLVFTKHSNYSFNTLTYDNSARHSNYFILQLGYVSQINTPIRCFHHVRRRIIEKSIACNMCAIRGNDMKTGSITRYNLHCLFYVTNGHIYLMSHGCQG